MNATNGTDYGCLDNAGDYGWTLGHVLVPGRGRHATLGMVAPGTVLTDAGYTYHAAGGDEGALIDAAAEFHSALNPLPISYGSFTYVGIRDPAVPLRALFTEEPIPSLFGTAGGTAGDDGISINWNPPRGRLSAAGTALHELVHAYFGAPDYYRNSDPSCNHLSTVAQIQGGRIGPKGRDAFAYWALRTRSLGDAQ